MKSFFTESKYLVIVAVMAMAMSLHAQNTSKVKVRNIPLWVKMMNDSSANYYAAIRDYEAFWKGKEKPTDEEHMMGKGTEVTKDHIRKLSKKEIREQRELDYYRYQCKRFENWVRINKPYVRSDGHILTADERLKLWQETQKSK